MNTIICLQDKHKTFSYLVYTRETDQESNDMVRTYGKRPKRRCQQTLEEETKGRLTERGTEWKGVRAIAWDQDRRKALFEPCTHIVEEGQLSKMKWFTFIRHWRKENCCITHFKYTSKHGRNSQVLQGWFKISLKETVWTKACSDWYTHKNIQNWKSELIYLIRPTTCTNKHIQGVPGVMCNTLEECSLC